MVFRCDDVATTNGKLTHALQDAYKFLEAKLTSARYHTHYAPPKAQFAVLECYKLVLHCAPRVFPHMARDPFVLFDCMRSGKVSSALFAEDALRKALALNTRTYDLRCERSQSSPLARRDGPIRYACRNLAWNRAEKRCSGGDEGM
jgi:hypothetical protein